METFILPLPQAANVRAVFSAGLKNRQFFRLVSTLHLKLNKRILQTGDSRSLEQKNDT